jgi:hypothetical protein
LRSQGQQGGKRDGAGRKTKAEEMGLPMLIEEVIGDEGKRELIKQIHEKAKSGSFNHQQLLMNYIFGKPTEKVVTKEIVEGQIFKINGQIIEF